MQFVLVGKIVEDLAGHGGIERNPFAWWLRTPGESDQTPTDAILMGVAALAIDKDDLLTFDDGLILHATDRYEEAVLAMPDEQQSQPIDQIGRQGTRFTMLLVRAEEGLANAVARDGRPGLSGVRVPLGCELEISIVVFRSLRNTVIVR